MAIPFPFVTGYDGPFEARHTDVPLLRKPVIADRLHVVLAKLVGPGGWRDERDDAEPRPIAAEFRPRSGSNAISRQPCRAPKFSPVDAASCNNSEDEQ
jgi:hypothetical protein